MGLLNVGAVHGAARKDEEAGEFGHSFRNPDQGFSASELTLRNTDANWSNRE
jgi:hypothetical protein